MQRLATAALLAAQRGPDAWGITTETSERRGMGRLSAQHVTGLPPSRVVVGHCRLATVLGTKTPEACQPIRAGRFVVAHNGSVPNAADLVERFGLSPTTGNDSEVIALLLGVLEGPASNRLAEALAQIDHGGHYAVSVLDTSDSQVLLRARGIPLWRHITQDGMYWASIRPGMEWEPVYA
jgi:asparagine synthetase B (glutamine-hydrolysing)